MESVNYDVLDKYLARGLCAGTGDPEGRVCVEAAICLAMGLPISANPPCTASSLRSYKILLNDCKWSSPEARSEGLRALSYAQIGTAGKLNEEMFASRLGELTIRILVPVLFRGIGICKEAADRCEREGTPSACRDAEEAAKAGGAAWAEKVARYAAGETWETWEAAWAARAAQIAWDEVRMEKADIGDPDKFLKLSASLCLLALKEQGFVGERKR
ncbi:MAG: hypothetical protein MN733_05995 [Nitrososphaera sp.]|nr:hypothetical protein [Nitrososphaera sp.]